jgi:hypothetical protein
MDESFRCRERRDSIRLKMIYPALYTRFDNEGRECDQKISRSMDLGLGYVQGKGCLCGTLQRSGF